MVLFAWGDWLDSSSFKTLLEEASVYTTASSKDATFSLGIGKKNIFVDLVGSDLDHADKRNITATFNDTFFEGMSSVASTDNKIGFGPNQVFRHQLQGRSTIWARPVDSMVSVWNFRV